MASKIPQQAHLISTLPSSGDSDNCPPCDMAWDQKGRLLVAQMGRLDRLTIDQDKGHLLKAENLYTDRHQVIKSVSVNNSGDVGAVIIDDDVVQINFHTTTGEPQVWSPDPAIDDFCSIEMFEDKYCLCPQFEKSTVYIYNLADKSRLHSIPLHNEGYLSRITRSGDHTLVITECDTASLILVDINTREVTRVTPKHPGGENVLGDPRSISCDVDNNIYVRDLKKYAVVVLSPQGEYLSTLRRDPEGSWGGEDSWELAVSSRPSQCPLLAVSDNDEVKIYTLTGN